jgi:hypothetical protein
LLWRKGKYFEEEKSEKWVEDAEQMREEGGGEDSAAFGRAALCKRLRLLLYSQILCSLPPSTLPKPAFT